MQVICTSILFLIKISFDNVLGIMWHFRYFALVREKDPFRLELMEYYSTALWHLQVNTCFLWF